MKLPGVAVDLNPDWLLSSPHHKSCWNQLWCHPLPVTSTCDTCFCYHWWELSKVMTQSKGRLDTTTGGWLPTSCCVWQIIALVKRCFWFWCTETSRCGSGAPSEDMSDDTGKPLMSSRRVEGHRADAISSALTDLGHKPTRPGCTSALVHGWF